MTVSNEGHPPLVVTKRTTSSSVTTNIPRRAERRRSEIKLGGEETRMIRERDYHEYPWREIERVGGGNNYDNNQ